MAVINSISGVRFTYDNIDYSFLKRFAIAYHNFSPDGAIAIGRDGRPSGVRIEYMLNKFFEELGRSVILLGIVPTPTVQIYVKSHNLSGGIVITASHNPKEWNGLKFLNSEGIFLNKTEHNLFSSLIPKNVDNFNEQALTEHIESVISLPFIDVSNICDYFIKNKYIFEIDAVNSAGSKAIPDLLNRIGVLKHKVFCKGDGNFPHIPEPLPENLTALSERVLVRTKRNPEHKRIGIAVDPDADRLVLLDEDGNCIGEEKTICIAIDAYLTLSNTRSNVVVNQSTTMLAEYIAKKHGYKCYRSEVGEINVVEAMKQYQAFIGGEGSGGVILAQCHYGRDSLVGIVLVLALLAHKQCSLKELVAEYPKYVMLKEKFNITGSRETIIDKILKHQWDADITTSDGVRITFADAFIHARFSNTEPIMRIIVEAMSQQRASELISQVKKIIEI